MTNKNYTPIGRLVGNYLDEYLYDNRRKESALKFSDRVGFSAKTISRWRTNGVTSLEGLDCVLQAMGKKVRVIIEDDDDPDFFYCFPVRIIKQETPCVYIRTRHDPIRPSLLKHENSCDKFRIPRENQRRK